MLQLQLKNCFGVIVKHPFSLPAMGIEEPPEAPYAAMARVLRAARKRAGLTQRNVGDALGTSEQAVSNWERGTARPDVQKFPDLSRIYNVPLSYLMNGAAWVTDAPHSGRRLQIINRIENGGWEEVGEPNADEEKFIVVEDAAAFSDGAFALEISGESNLPEYRPGDVVIIDPEVLPRPGDMVAAKLADTPQATFKRYRPRGKGDDGNIIVDLVPLNPDYPTLTISEKSPGEIVGVMVEHRRYRARDLTKVWKR